MALGRKDEALDLALLALPEGDSNILVGQMWNAVRDDPRYKTLVRRAGLEHVLASTSARANPAIE
jgi:hypothetical protein